MAKTLDTKIAEALEKKEQYEAQIKRLIGQQKEQDRKARTKRLIEHGAIIESLVPELATLTNGQFKAFLERTITNDFARRALASVTDTPQKTAEAIQRGGAGGSEDEGNGTRQGG